MFCVHLQIAIYIYLVINRGSLVEGSGAATVDDLVRRFTWVILTEVDVRNHRHSTLQHNYDSNCIPLN